MNDDQMINRMHILNVLSLRALRLDRERPRDWLKREINRYRLLLWVRRYGGPTPFEVFEDTPYDYGYEGEGK